MRSKTPSCWDGWDAAAMGLLWRGSGSRSLLTVGCFEIMQALEAEMVRFAYACISGRIVSV